MTATEISIDIYALDPQQCDDCAVAIRRSAGTRMCDGHELGWRQRAREVRALLTQLDDERTDELANWQQLVDQEAS